MNGKNLMGLGALGALSCVAACAAAAIIPALMAGGGLALVAERFMGWQSAVGLALLAGLAIWWIARRARQRSCACPQPPAESQP